VDPATSNQQPATILVIKPSSLGDIVHTLPAVARLKRHWPESRIRWVVNTEWMPLLEGNPHLDEVIEFPRREFRGLRGALKIAPWARALRERVPADLILDFQGLLRSALIAKLCRGEMTRVLGLSDAREGARFFYDEVVDTTSCEHAVDRYLALAALATGTPAEDENLDWPLPPGIAIAGVPDAPFVLLHPFSRGSGKSLSESDVVAFCHAAAPHRIIIAGRTEAKLPAIPNALDLLNRTTLHELIWLLRRARFIVSVDSGPMHIAAALTPNLVSIHTWSDPRKVGPYRDDAWILAGGHLKQRRHLAVPDAGIAMPDIAALARWVSERTEA
jgi:lipopolysaccharide heptosyltransferase I